jgi:hypothetical protein
VSITYTARPNTLGLKALREELTEALTEALSVLSDEMTALAEALTDTVTEALDEPVSAIALANALGEADNDETLLADVMATAAGPPNVAPLRPGASHAGFPATFAMEHS